MHTDPESSRLSADEERLHNWKRWGPYLAERQWGTVREDYSTDGNCWDYFTHEQARSRAYRWGEDGLLGFTDRQCRICMSLALWNGRDPFLKERLFGLTGHQGNHSEDVKEEYYYLRSTPTHSWMKALYKYPQRRFPYGELIDENHRRSRADPEYELADTGAFKDGHFDVTVEFAKEDAEDILIRWTAVNRGPRTATIHLLPHIWFRNVWTWGAIHLTASKGERPVLWQQSPGCIEIERASLGRYTFEAEQTPDFRDLLFTENSTNYHRIFGAENHDPFVKDAFHEYVTANNRSAVNPARRGTKAAAHYVITLPPGGSKSVRVRFRRQKDHAPPAFADFDSIMNSRERECDEFYGNVIAPAMDDEAREISLQAYAGLLWTKQFYYYAVATWLPGDPSREFPAEIESMRRNRDWQHLFARDVISMPDKWEYPWFAAWDLAFHTVPLAMVDAGFAKKQLNLLLREWYMHPNGQIPAYEFSFSDVNPPVHAWAAWRVYCIDAERSGTKDRAFLAGVFQKLLLNFTWWVNRKDKEGHGIFSGGFLGLDNIGIFDRNEHIPGGTLQQADATAWMAFYSAMMMRMAIELSWDGKIHPAYQDMASKFLSHFLQIVDAVHTHGGTGLWDALDGFYYDHLSNGPGISLPLKSRSLVGLLPLVAVDVLDQEQIERLPEFKSRFDWYLRHWPLFSRHIVARTCEDGNTRWLVALASRDRLVKVLRRMSDPSEFLSSHGIRSLSRAHLEQPLRMEHNGEMREVRYDPGDSTTGMFGGNSNWRGPVWFPINHLLIEALERYHSFFGHSLFVEYPTHSGLSATLQQIADDLKKRHSSLFRKGIDGRRPCHGGDDRYANDAQHKDLVLFYEFFHGDTGAGHGASHQTGWTALVACHLDDLARSYATRFSRKLPDV